MEQPGNKYCVVRRMKEYIRSRPGRPNEPFFRTAEGRPLRRDDVNRAVAAAAAKLGLPEHRYTSHSIRIGAATVMAEQGASEMEIKQRGRWTSDAFMLYIRQTIRRIRAASEYLRLDRPETAPLHTAVPGWTEWRYGLDAGMPPPT